MSISVDRTGLMTDSWTAQVDDLEAALNSADLRPCDGCRIFFSESQVDSALHVTIVKPRETMMVSVWARPAVQPDGSFHYVRSFVLEPTDEIARHIRDMWGAPPV
mgnify:CR=1 FL=1